MEDDAIETMFGPIRVRFRQSLNGHVAAIGQIIEGRSGLSAREALQDIATRAHKISGVAATLGYDDIGRSATAVENSINILQRSAAFARPDVERMQTLVFELLDRMQAEA